MPAIVLTSLRNVPNAPQPAKQSADPYGEEPPASPHETMLELAAQYVGKVAESSGGDYLIFFPTAPDAVRYALAVQGRLATYNRQNAVAGKVHMRIGIHANAAAESGQVRSDYRVSEEELNVATQVLNETPVGRVFVSRPVFDQCRNSSSNVFIPLGLEYFRGIANPIEFYEAAAVAGLGRSASRPPRPTAAKQESTQAPEDSAKGGLDSVVLDWLSAPMVYRSVILALALLMYSSQDTLMMLFTPVEWLNNAAFFLGGRLCGMLGMESVVAFAAIAAMIVVPVLVVRLCEAWSRLGPAFAARLWLGESLFSIGFNGGPDNRDLSSFGEKLHAAWLSVWQTTGFSAISTSVARAIAAFGLFYIAMVLVDGGINFIKSRHAGAGAPASTA